MPVPAKRKSKSSKKRWKGNVYPNIHHARLLLSRMKKDSHSHEEKENKKTE